MLSALTLSEWVACTMTLLLFIFVIAYVKLQYQLKSHQKIFELSLDQKLLANTKLLEEVSKLQNEIHYYQQENIAQNIKISELKTRLEETISATSARQKLLEQNEQRLNTQFENLANRIFEHNGKKIEEQNKQSLHYLLSPLKEQLENFKKQVQDSFGQEAKERHTLTHEIRHLKQLNELMTKEATNLTNALKGNNKIQGNWGEVILNQILESSGLRNGHEYATQVSLVNEDQQRFQPDVIVYLPEQHHVIIDAKVTLVAYERYFNSENDNDREKALAEHLSAIRGHIKQLSQKDYHKLIGIDSLDYILMFIPVEPAFLTAIQHDSSLVSDAYKQNIMLVSPSTLLIALRTIHNLWRYEYQNQHAEFIADRASKLYDKVRGFVDDMENLGLIIDKAQQTYRGSMNKLYTGKGNIIAHVERFRELGIEVKKPISEKLTTTALNNDN